MKNEIIWQPHKGAQTNFLKSSVKEVLYGGAAGGGKSDCLLMDALRSINFPRYTGIIFRRQYPALSDLIERSKIYYPVCGGKYNQSSHVWSFPSGARIRFGHMQYEDDCLAHRSNEYQYIGFDELTTFTEKQYRFLFSRLRSSQGLPLFIRGATNPGGVGHEWVRKRFAPWIFTEIREDIFPGFSGPFIEPGKPLYVIQENNQDKYFSEKTKGAVSRTFIPALLSDNPSIDESYKDNLRQLDPVTRRQQEYGDWFVKPSSGEYFKIEWCNNNPPNPPANAKWIRYWDFAGTKSTHADYTAGVLMAEFNSHVWIVDVKRFQENPGKVQEILVNTARQDGPNVQIGLEQDPGQAGKFQIDILKKELRGFTVRINKPDRDKLTRFLPFSAAASNGMVSVMNGLWKQTYVDELSSFPNETEHDDQVDATSGAFRILCPAVTSNPVRKNQVINGWF